MNIPSPRQLNLKRFDRPDFRCTTRRGKRAAGWTWSRALYRLRRWHQTWSATFDRDIAEPFRVFVRAAAALKARRPELAAARARTTQEWATVVRLVQRSSMSEPHPARGVVETGVGRQSTPARSTERRRGAHRFELLNEMPNDVYGRAMQVREIIEARVTELTAISQWWAGQERLWKGHRVHA